MYLYKIAFSRLRTFSHRLVDSNRWTRHKGKPLNERLFFCNNLGDEVHFILEWPIYNDYRGKYVLKTKSFFTAYINTLY